MIIIIIIMIILIRTIIITIMMNIIIIILMMQFNGARRTSCQHHACAGCLERLHAEVRGSHYRCSRNRVIISKQGILKTWLILCRK